MPRKHQAIIQYGGNKGKLKKGYRYSGKKLKNGLPQIVKVKKTKKKTMYGSGKTNETEEAKREQPQGGAWGERVDPNECKENKHCPLKCCDQINNQCINSSLCNFSVVTHNIGPANQRWVHYNYENKPPKIFYEGPRNRYTNACFVKQNKKIHRNFETYYPNQEKYDIYLLQELQEGDEDNEELIFSANKIFSDNYKGYYTTTGSVVYLVGNVKDLVLGNTESNFSVVRSENENEKSNIKRIIHGAAVIWNSDKFKFVRAIPSGVGFPSYDGLTKRATPWVILETIDKTTQYAFLSIQCPIDDEIREKGVETRDALIKSIEKLPNHVIPVIGGDLNKDLINKDYTPNPVKPSLDKKYKGINKFHYIPNKCIITNYNWSFEYKKVTKRDKKNKPIEYKEIDIIPNGGLSKKYNGCVDYFLIAGRKRKLSQFYLNFSNVQVNSGLMAMHRIENNEKFRGEKLHIKGNGGMKFYDPTYEMKQDFDHASISMTINNPIKNNDNDYNMMMIECNNQEAIRNQRIAEYKNINNEIENKIKILKQSITELQNQANKEDFNFGVVAQSIKKLETEKFNLQKKREKEEEEQFKEEEQFEDHPNETVKTIDVSNYTSKILEHEVWEYILKLKKQQREKQQQNLNDMIKQSKLKRQRQEEKKEKIKRQRQQQLQQQELDNIMQGVINRQQAEIERQWQWEQQQLQLQQQQQQHYYRQQRQQHYYRQQRQQPMQGQPMQGQQMQGQQMQGQQYPQPQYGQQGYPQQQQPLRGDPLNNYNTPLNTPLNPPFKPHGGEKTKKTKKTKKVRRHKGIIQNGGNKGKLKKGYKYSGKKLKNGLPEIVKSKSKKNNVNKR